MGPTSAACLLVPAARGAGEVGGAKVSFKSRIRLTEYLVNRLMELAIKLAVESGLGAAESTEIHKKCGYRSCDTQANILRVKIALSHL